jgi:hypothetical protein
MNTLEEKLEISEFNYKVLKGNYKHVVNERDKLKEDYKKLEDRYIKRYSLYCEKVKDKVELQNELEKTTKELKEYKDKYVKAMNNCNALILEREDLRKKNREVNRDFFIVSILMFISISIVILS